MLSLLFNLVVADTITVYKPSYIYNQGKLTALSIKYLHGRNGLLYIDNVIVSLMYKNSTIQSISTFSSNYVNNYTVVLQMPNYYNYIEYNDYNDYMVNIVGVGRYFEVSSGETKSLNTTENIYIKPDQIVVSSALSTSFNLVLLFLL